MNLQIVFMSIAVASGYFGGYFWGKRRRFLSVVYFVVCGVSLVGFFVEPLSAFLDVLAR